MVSLLTKMKKKYRSYDQAQLKQLSDIACDDIESLLELLEIYDYKICDKMVTMSCPIHGGDNPSALNLYYTGDNYRGNWKCRTHQCEEIFKSSIIGFVRGCLSRNNGWEKEGDTTVSFKDAVDFISKFTKQDLANLKVCKKQKEKNAFVNSIRYIKTEKEQKKNSISRSAVVKNLQIPSPYFLSRNFSKDTLIKYDVGECNISGKPMYQRAVVPIYNYDHTEMIGCSGRTTTEQMPKWKHSDGFRAEESLYAYWYAKQSIQKTGVVILVESPGNVWRLDEAGIFNAVGLYGSSLKDKQKMILDTSGAMTIITIMDNDEAGKKASQQIFNKCNKTYICKNININHADIAEMTVEEINKEIKPIIESYYI